MWKNKDYHELQTFGEWASEHDFASLFTGSQIDAATQQNILSWFFTRKVFTNDVEDFKRKFKIKLFTIESQYLNYLRVESTQFDPMVQNYMERLIQGIGNATQSTDVASTGGVTTTTDAENATKTDATKDINQTVTTTEDSSDKTDERRSGLNKTTYIGHRDTDETGTVKGTVSTTELTDELTDNKDLRGNLPRSSTYSSGVPTNLDWSMTSTQEQRRGTTATEKDGTTTTDSRTNRDESVNTNDTTTLSIDEDINKTGSAEKSGRATTTGKETNDTSVDGTTHSVAKTENTGTTATTGETATETETKERYSGRSQAPQDMLDRARNYILKTNAFTWLTTQMESVFMSIYEW